MLKYFLIIVLILSSSCNKSTDEPIMADEAAISGKWKATEAFISAGGPQYWVDVDNGEEIEFFNNGTFSSDRFIECSQGSYSLAENELRLEYDCEGFSTGVENDEGYITFRLELYPGYFVLTPTSGPICIEGCSYKYERKN